MYLYFHIVFFISFCFHFCCFLFIIGFGYLLLSLVMLNGFTELVKLNCVLTLEIKSLDSEDVVSFYRGFNFLWQSWDHMADWLTLSESGMILGSNFSIGKVWSAHLPKVTCFTTSLVYTGKLLGILIGLWHLTGSLRKFDFLVYFLELCETLKIPIEYRKMWTSLWASLWLLSPQILFIWRCSKPISYASSLLV